MSTDTKMEVAVYPVPVPESADKRGELFPWCHVRVDVRNLSLTVDHHFEYQYVPLPGPVAPLYLFFSFLF